MYLLFFSFYHNIDFVLLSTHLCFVNDVMSPVMGYSSNPVVFLNSVPFADCYDNLHLFFFICICENRNKPILEL
jgi:hypothetical protein